MITINDIQAITGHCLKLLSCTEYLRRDTATKEAHVFAESIFESIRKLFIASMMYNKTLICISGMQGAGKTTLMKNFYGIDDRYLDPTLGRGERIPILITEKEDISAPMMYAVKIDTDPKGNYFQHKKELAADEIAGACRGEDSKIMYIELYVPYRHTFNEGISFMLLPGFENTNNYWDNLIEFSVNSSDAAVFVFNETSFSNAAVEKYLKKIEEKFGKNLVYAISGSDGSPDNNAEVKQTCISTLNIPANEADRVVCSGLFADENKNKEWIEQFKNALEKYAYTGIQQFRNNSTYLYKEILKIKESLFKILEILKDDDSAEMRDYSKNAMLKEFDRTVRKKRKEFEENLEDAFEAAKKESGKKLEEQFDKRPKLNTVKRFFFGSNVKEQFTQTRETIEKSLKYDGDKYYLPDKYLGEALQRSLVSMDHPETKTNLGYLIDTKKNGDKTLLLADGEKSRALTNDVHNLLADNSQNEVNGTIQSTDSRKLLSAVVEIGTYFYSLASYNEIAEKTGSGYYEPSQTHLVPDDVVNGAVSSKRFVAGMAGVMGIDLIGDGTINMVSQIAASLGVAAPVAGAAAIAIVAAGAFSVVLKDLNRMQRDDFQSARLAVNGIYDDLKLKALESYDIYMGKIRDRIEDNIRVLNGDGKKIIVEHNAKIEINNALDLLEKFSEEYAEDVYGLESTFS